MTQPSPSSSAFTEADADYLSYGAAALQILDHMEGNSAKKVRFALALGHVREDVRAGVMPFWIITAALTATLAGGLLTGAIMISPALMPFAMCWGLLSSATVFSLQRYQRMNRALQALLSDSQHHGESYVRTRVQKLAALKPKPSPSPAELWLSRFSERLATSRNHPTLMQSAPPQGPSFKNPNTPQPDPLPNPSPNPLPDPLPDLPPQIREQFLASARRLGEISVSLSQRYAHLSPGDALSKAHRFARFEARMHPPLWPRLLLNSLSRRQRPEEIALPLGCLELAHDWYQTACTGPHGVSVPAAYKFLEEKLQL